MSKPIPHMLNLDFNKELTSSSHLSLPWTDPYTTVNKSYLRLLPSRIDRVIDVIETGEKYELCL